MTATQTGLGGRGQAKSTFKIMTLIAQLAATYKPDLIRHSARAPNLVPNWVPDRAPDWSGVRAVFLRSQVVTARDWENRQIIEF